MVNLFHHIQFMSILTSPNPIKIFSWLTNTKHHMYCCPQKLQIIPFSLIHLWHVQCTSYFLLKMFCLQFCVIVVSYQFICHCRLQWWINGQKAEITAGILQLENKLQNYLTSELELDTLTLLYSVLSVHPSSHNTLSGIWHILISCNLHRIPILCMTCQLSVLKVKAYHPI